MTKIDYSNYLKNSKFDIDENYYNLFEYKEKKFNKLKKIYPYNLLFHDIELKKLYFLVKNFYLK